MKARIPVPQLVEKFDLVCLQEGFEDPNWIEGSSVYYAGLALAGYLEHLGPQRAVLFGISEAGYLASLDPDEAREALARFLEIPHSCLICQAEIEVPAWLPKLAQEKGLGVYQASRLKASAIQPLLSQYLRDCLAPQETIHGVMMDVSGTGVLLQGPSGIGKSECALELIKRGHRLVADDAVVVKRISDRVAVAEPRKLWRHAMELRGLGLIDVRSLFGMGAISDRIQIELVIRLEKWDPERTYERLGIEPSTREIAGVPIPFLVIPVIEAKNLSILVEVAAMNQHLRNLGVNSARELTEELEARLRGNDKTGPSKG